MSSLIKKDIMVNKPDKMKRCTVYTTEPSSIIASTLYNVINCSYGIQNQCKVSSNIHELRDKIIDTETNTNSTLIKHENDQYIRQLITNNIENNNHEMIYQYLCDPLVPYII